jgi:vacuolar-type H+-ATPase subunit C/Vma6
MAGLEYTNARIRGMKSFLIKESEIRIALELKTAADFAVWLENTPYKALLEGKAIADINSALFRDWIRTNGKIARIVPDGMREFLSARASAFEIEALKLLINSKSGEAGGTGDVESYLVFLSRKLKSKERELVAADSVEKLVDLLEGTGYGIMLKRWADEGKELTSELDRYYYEKMWFLAGKLPGGQSGAARKLMGAEIDIVNIMNILRSKSPGTEKETELIPIFNRLRKAVASESIKAPDVKGAVSALSGTPYGRVLDEQMQEHEKTRSLFCFEMGLRRYLLREHRKAMFVVFSIGVALGFLKLKEFEISNMRSIAYGIDNGLGKDQIEGMLIA